MKIANLFLEYSTELNSWYY